MNRIIISGRLTRDPERRESGSGLIVTNFSVAVNRPFAKEKTVDYMDCVAFRKSAEFIAKWFSKGKPILIEGHLQSRDWEDKNGNKRRSWEVIVDQAEFFSATKSEQDIPQTAPGEMVPLEGGDPFADGEVPFDMENDPLDSLPV